MKRLLFLTFTLLMVLSLSGCGLCDRDDDDGEDRYQLIVKDNLVLKFDSETGNTWRRDGNTWVFLQEVNGDDESGTDDTRDFQLCRSMIAINAPLKDIRSADAFDRLSEAGKLRVYEAFYQHHHLWQDENQDSVLMRQLHKAMREDLGID